MTHGPVSRLPWARFGAEALIIVSSILLALGVDEWREDRDNRILEREYLIRLLRDLDTNLNRVDLQRQLDARKVAFARSVYPLVANGEWGELTRERAVIDAYLASPSDAPIWVDDTFEELKSTGRLALIRNPDIRSGVVAYYRVLEAGDWAIEMRSTEYRDSIRSRMNPDLQLAIRESCAMNATYGALQFEASPEIRDSCRLSNTDINYDEFLSWLENNRELADGLARVIVQWTRSVDQYLPSVQSATNDLKQLISAELDR